MPLTLKYFVLVSSLRSIRPLKLLCSIVAHIIQRFFGDGRQKQKKIHCRQKTIKSSFQVNSEQSGKKPGKIRTFYSTCGKKIDKNGKKDPDFSPDFLEILRISQKCPEKVILWSFVGSEFFFVFAGHPRKNIE